MGKSSIEVNATSPAIPESARCRLQFIQSWPSSCFSQELSIFPIAGIRVLALRCSMTGDFRSNLPRLND